MSPQKRKDTPMLKVSDGMELEKGREETRVLLDEVVREGARRMLIAALEAEQRLQLSHS